ncbi:MAG: prepilin-type N-terminal cleavage/methylation domain-containing protein [Elusimicrobiota bacterium]
MRLANSERGFTLVEILVAVVIVGVVAAIAVPQYTEAVETAKADNAATKLLMVGAANRIYHADNPTIWAGNGTAITNRCNRVRCGSATPNCKLVACGYLPKEDWDAIGYTITPVAGISGVVARAQRCSDGGSGCTNNEPYTNWGYEVTDSGRITESGGARQMGPRN